MGANASQAEAEAALRKQIEVNPYDAYAYNNLGLALVRLGRFDEAAKAFAKQIEIVPLDIYAHKNLGSLLMQRKRCPEAIAELETAAQSIPMTSRYLCRWSVCYETTSKHEMAKALNIRISASLQKNKPVITSVQGFSIDANEDPVQVEQKARLALKAMAAMNPAIEDLSGIQGGILSLSVCRSWFDIGRAEMKLGNLDKAEPYLKSAWMMSQSGVVGNYLGQLYEKEHKVAAAIDTYSKSMGSGRAQR